MVSISPNSVETVTGSFAGDTVSAVLFGSGSADGVAVIAAEEDDGTVEGGGEVEGGVGVAFGRRAVAEVADYDPSVLRSLERVRRSHRLRHLSRQRRRDGHKVVLRRAIMHRHLLALA